MTQSSGARLLYFVIGRRARYRAKLMNYVGQVRLYSLVDLLFQFVAAGVTYQSGIAGIALWLGFLAFLEWMHEDRGREPVPWYWAAILTSFGFGAAWHWHSLPFLALSVAYTTKIYPGAGLVSPVIRGMQQAFLLLAVGASYDFAQVVGWVTGTRNLIGDVRDIKKDHARQTLTIPGLFRIDPPHWPLHLMAVMATTALWCWYAPILVWALPFAWLIQITTYNWTPR